MMQGNAVSCALWSDAFVDWPAVDASRLPPTLPAQELQLREGYGGRLASPKLPATPGGDVAGVVVEADAGSKFKPGTWWPSQPALGLDAAWGLTLPVACMQGTACSG